MKPPDNLRVKQVASRRDRSAQELVSGEAVPEDHSHTQLKVNGQQQDYVVLTSEARAKGFVRPVRRSYRHVGPLGPKHPLRDLDPVAEAPPYQIRLR